MRRARYRQALTDAEVARAMGWIRFKRRLLSREVVITVVALLLATAFLCGRVFAAEPALSCVPSADGFLPPGCESSSVATLKEWLAGAALLLLFVGSLLVLHVLMFRDRREDEGRVLPRRGWE